MIPNIIVLGKEIGIYGILATIGIFVYGFYIIKMSKKKKIDSDYAINTSLVAAIGLFIGGHLLYAITNIETIINLFNNYENISSFKNFILILYYIFGGAVFYGGLLGGILFGYIYLKKKKLNIKKYSDVIAPGIPLFHTFGRIGCFLGGCCYGIESEFGFIYHHSPIQEANDVTRFPIQLVEATCNLILFTILNKLLKNNKYQGKLIYIYLFCYAIIRFIIEFFRGDTYRGFLFGISTSQIISILILITILIIYIFKKLKKDKN